MHESTARALPKAIGQQLSRWGFILEQDKVLPSVASAIAGAPIAGSWWGSTASHDIYDALEALEEQPDVLRVKLVSSKVTFVSNRLWPAVLSVAQARDAWQLDGFTPDDFALLDLVDGAGFVRLDELPGPSKALRDSALKLERRLLVYGDQLHTDTGAHTRTLQSWPSWLAAGRRSLDRMPVEDAKRSLEDAVTLLNTESGAKATLPWQAPSSKR